MSCHCGGYNDNFLDGKAGFNHWSLYWNDLVIIVEQNVIVAVV